MRAAFILFLLVLGGVFGIVVDRMPATRGAISALIGSSTVPVSSPVSPYTLGTSVDYTFTLGEDGRVAGEALAAFSAKTCFSEYLDGDTESRDWLDRDTLVRGTAGTPRPDTFPDLGDYPGLIKIEMIRSARGADRDHCGAVRVAAHWFLTAAHCFEAEDPNRAVRIYDVLAVEPSQDVRTPGTAVMPIRGALCHGEHGISRLRYPTDIALFYVSDVTPFAGVAIAELETSERQLSRQDFAAAYISGWGSNGSSRYFQGGPVTVSQLGESVLVSERIGARGPNIGDSGAPLYVDFGQGPLVVGTLLQVTQDEAGLGETGIYVRSKSIRDWVSRTIAICEQGGAYVC